MIFNEAGTGSGAGDPPAPSAPPSSTAPPAPEPTSADSIPRSRFNEVNERAKTLETENADMRKRLDALEAEKLSDTEKAQREAEGAKDRAGKAEARAKTAERRLHVTLAAAQAGVDPEIAVALLADAEIESDAQAAEAVTKLVERKPELAGSAGSGGGAPTPFGRPAGGDAPPPPGGGNGAPSTGDPKRDLGAGLLAAMTGKRGGS